MAANHPKAPDHSFEDWLGRERTTEDTITLERARKLAATLDLDPAALEEGAPLPYGWHWIYHRAAAPRSALAEDGHERRGDFLPPIPLDRRMWAGGRLRFARPLLIGTPVRRVSTIRSIEEKEGRSGPLAFVTVEHRLHDADGVALEEEQDLVYLDRRPGEGGSEGAKSSKEAGHGAEGEGRGGQRAGRGGERAGRGGEHGAGPDWTESFVADEVTLFRFSALTFNGHRIHYDRAYATGVEGYPDLVVHGPLLALLLVGVGGRWAAESGGEGGVVGAGDMAGPGSSTALDPARHRSTPGTPVLDFTYRALQPVFCNEEIELCGRVASGTGASAAGTSSRDGRTGGRFELWAAHPDRGVAMRAGLEL